MSLPMFHDSCHEEAVLQSRFTHYSFTHLFFNLNSRYAQYGLFSVASHGHILKKETCSLCSPEGKRGLKRNSSPLSSTSSFFL